MEKKVTQKKTVTKNTISKSKKTTKNKSDFDVDAFVFEVDISKIEDWVKGICIELDDPEFEWPSYDEQYWLGRWLTDLPYYRAHNIQKTLVSARESAILGLYDKTQKKKGAKK
ncbi:MAG: hypothetical protein ACRC6V_13235 [Bacteroidales bacterium]